MDFPDNVENRRIRDGVANAQQRPNISNLGHWDDTSPMSEKEFDEYVLSGNADELDEMIYRAKTDMDMNLDTKPDNWFSLMVDGAIRKHDKKSARATPVPSPTPDEFGQFSPRSLHSDSGGRPRSLLSDEELDILRETLVHHPNYKSLFFGRHNGLFFGKTVIAYTYPPRKYGDGDWFSLQVKDEGLETFYQIVGNRHLFLPIKMKDKKVFLMRASTELAEV